MNKLTIFISILFLTKGFLTDVFSYASSNAIDNEDRARKIKQLCYQEFSNFERKLIDHVIEDLKKNHQLSQVNHEFLKTKLLSFQELIDSKLIEYFQIKGEKFIEKAKKNRDKHGLTFDSFMLLTDF